MKTRQEIHEQAEKRKAEVRSMSENGMKDIDIAKVLNLSPARIWQLRTGWLWKPKNGPTGDS